MLHILHQALDLNEKRRHLERYSTWTQGDTEEFADALRMQRRVDDTRWK